MPASEDGVAGGPSAPYDEPERAADLRRVRAGDVEIVVARYAGYCYGVERALRLTGEALEGAPAPVATLGPIIHNPRVVGSLEERGVHVVDDVGQAGSGTLIVRTHGVPPDVLEHARSRRLNVVDATCPFVSVAQRKAAMLRDAGYAVVILGERDHPEVVGLQGFAGADAVVVEDASGLPLERLRGRRVGVVVQTTQTRANLSALAAELAPAARELLVFNTVCDATEKRQSAACEMAEEVDVVVVVGGRNSANTAKLVEIARSQDCDVLWIEHAGELSADWFARRSKIGIAAGASTPDWLIEEVKHAIETSQVSRGMDGYDGRNDE